MLLQKALRELDGEIQRLSRVRAIVAGLHTTKSLSDFASSARDEVGARDSTSLVKTGDKTSAIEKLSTPEPVTRARTETKSPVKVKNRSTLKDVTEAEVMMEPLLSVVVSETIASEPVLEEAKTSEPRKLRRLRFERATRTRRTAPPEARALGGSIPVQPVFISSANAARTPVKTRVSETAAGTHKGVPAAEGTLDALLRELSYRPSPGA